MYRHLSRAQREAAFLEKAAHMYSALEDWYDQHPAASFGEIEAAARNLRRELMGDGLAVLINGRDTGYQLEAPLCSVWSGDGIQRPPPLGAIGLGRRNRADAGLLRLPRLRRGDAFSPWTRSCC
ncbi:MAG: hypothetical protein KKA73_15890 [Chloroflexi bacterium]|nr:hypothetical protein [Chloroflexota bacterium]MBU1749166.1 hypothetical protein [Chloroflexota bacterium]